jgi:hypothetical protein
VIIEGMFIINTSPLSTHKTFDDYAEFLFLKTSQKENSPDFFSVLCQIENVYSLSLVNQSCQKYM